MAGLRNEIFLYNKFLINPSEKGKAQKRDDTSVTGLSNFLPSLVSPTKWSAVRMMYPLMFRCHKKTVENFSFLFVLLFLRTAREGEQTWGEFSTLPHTADFWKYVASRETKFIVISGLEISLFNGFSFCDLISYNNNNFSFFPYWMR